MGTPTDRVDLFVVGTDFYFGSTRAEGRLRDGWCSFRALGQQQAKKHLDRSSELGRIWYLTEQVSRLELRSFEEHERQRMWLSVLGSDVTRLIIDDKCQKPNSGNEFRFRTEKAAISFLRGTFGAPHAMVISGEHEQQTALLSFLEEEYRQPLILVPPDFEMQDSGCSDVQPLSHADLGAARLMHDDVWREYEKSRARRKQVANWAATGLAALRPGLTVRLNNKRPHRNPESWKKWANDDHEILERTKVQVTRFLESCAEYKDLAIGPSCITFIARSNIKDVAAEVAENRWGPVSENRSSIRNGRDLIAQAATAYPAIEICENAERQIIEMRGSEKHFSWVLEALDRANREMRAWAGGPFPHRRLPGPATGESDSTMAKPWLREMRRFITRSGKPLLFEYHMKCKAENQRIHYLVDQCRRLLMIGYVGEHLPL